MVLKTLINLRKRTDDRRLQLLTLILYIASLWLYPNLKTKLM